MAVTLYMNPVSTACRPVSLLIAEKKMPVTEQFVDLMKGEHHGAAFSSINPCHLVPVLEDGDFRMAESSAILKYLASQDEETAKLLDNISGTVFTLGDNVYPDGTASQFSDCYGPTWGRHKNRTNPVPGNHDYHVSGASAYYNYFGAAAGDPNKGYYSYNLGAWHIIALNSEVGYQAGSAQEQWLKADLAANQNVCTLAYFHHARFSSGQHGNITRMQPFWQALYDNGADVVVSGHDHTYERFAPQNPSGQADATRGIREFVVGTGGSGLYPMPSIQPNSQVRNNTTYGVLKLTLHSASYDWEFVPIAGQTFTDSGSANCVGGGSVATATRTPTSGPAPTATRTPTPGPTATRTPTAGATTIMHIGDLDGAGTLQGNKWTVTTTITVHDANHNPVSNATVTGTWSNGASGTATCTTGSNGQCTVTKSDISKGRSSVTFTVNNVTRAASTYTAANNHDPDGGSNGTRIVVARP